MSEENNKEKEISNNYVNVMYIVSTIMMFLIFLMIFK